MRPLRVAIVAPSLGILGGHAVQADRLIRAWHDDPEVDAWLVPINPPPPLLLGWAARVKYCRTLATELTYLPLLARELARADVVHVFSASYTSFLLAPLPAMMVARSIGRPVVLNYRSGEALDHLKRSAIARRAIAGADANVVPSPFLVEVFEHCGIGATVIPNLVDLERFRFRTRDPLQPRLLSTRNLAYPYNVGCTLRAFRIVQRERPDAALTLVGSGADEPALRRLAADLGLRRVTFAGRVAPEAIADYYAASDIYIQSPDIDNMPTSVIEAFASGLPVVSTRAGGVPVLIEDGEQGLLAPLDDHEALAAQILRLLAEPDLGRRLARNAREACQAYAWPAVRDEWLRAYRGVLSRYAERRPASVLDPAAGRSIRLEPNRTGSEAASAEK
jgi:glycosyltransferase involved in cell wall biosynthesis